MIFKNIKLQYDSSELNNYKLGSQCRGYSEKDERDIILDFFSKHGEKAYKIAKKMFDEERIQTKYNGKIFRNSLAIFSGSTLLQSSYICTSENKTNTIELKSIVHEIGHAIDAEIFIYPQQKKLTYLEDIFLEIPSTYFEISFLNYLKENKIDVNMALTVETLRMFNMCRYASYALRILNDEDEIDVMDLRYNFIYAIGYYMSFAMNELSRQNPKEYFKYLCNVLCSRNESDFTSLVEMASIDSDRFVSGEIASDIFEKQTLALKRRYNIKE